MSTLVGPAPLSKILFATIGISGGYGLASPPDQPAVLYRLEQTGGFSNLLDAVSSVDTIDVDQATGTRFETVYAALSASAQLRENWDGYGAQRVHPTALLSAYKFLSNIPSAAKSPQVSPTIDGCVTFKWKSDTVVAVIEFDRNGSYSYFADEGDDQLGSDDVPASVVPAELLNRILRV